LELWLHSGFGRGNERERKGEGDKRPESGTPILFSEKRRFASASSGAFLCANVQYREEKTEIPFVKPESVISGKRRH